MHFSSKSKFQPGYCLLFPPHFPYSPGRLEEKKRKHVENVGTKHGQGRGFPLVPILDLI